MLVIGSYELPEVGNEELGSSGREAMLLTQSSLQHLDLRHFEAVYTRSVRDQKARMQVVGIRTELSQLRLQRWFYTVSERDRFLSCITE